MKSQYFLYASISKSILSYMKDSQKSSKIAIILGGSLSQERKEDAISSKKPRVDVMEMESRFHAKLFDYTWLEQLAKNELGARILLKIVSTIDL